MLTNLSNSNELIPSTRNEGDSENDQIHLVLDTNEEDNALKIIDTINNEMLPNISTTSEPIGSLSSIPAIPSPKVSFSMPNRIRIIHSSDLVGKTLLNNGVCPKVINISSSGTLANKDVIKLVSGTTFRNYRTTSVSTGGSSAKIIRIMPQKEIPSLLPQTTIGSDVDMKMITIQSGNVMDKMRPPRTVVSLSPKGATSNLTSTIVASSAPNYIILTPTTMSFPTKTIATTSSLLRPVQCADIKREAYSRFVNADINNRRHQRMELGGISNCSTWQQYVSQYAHLGPCPICEDSISGYHYGIFCCESCKGFFKRSVQNHKDYVCHIQQSGGESCNINKHTRKKCPSCRFQRCVDKGMRIEAVRNDRSRGGRSLYPGSRNRVHRYPLSDFTTDSDSQKSSMTTTDQSRCTNYIRQLNSSTNFLTSSVTESLPSPGVTKLFEFSRNMSLSTNGPLHRALSSRGRTSMMSVLDNIVVIEEQLQQERDVLGPTMEDDDLGVYRVLLKLAEQRLHRMVRWSRALPEFAAIDTDDQIMLVQNCWAELLILDCCYRSLGDPREIHLTTGKCINLEAACELGAKDVVEFIVQMTTRLAALRLDLREYACMKVLLLMQPGLRHLKAEARVRMFQETVSQLLLDHTTSNYETEQPNKFYELVSCVPEIRAASISVKRLLTGKDLSGYLNSNSLLLELLNCTGSSGGSPMVAAPTGASVSGGQGSVTIAVPVSSMVVAKATDQ